MRKVFGFFLGSLIASCVALVLIGRVNEGRPGGAAPRTVAPVGTPVDVSPDPRPVGEVFYRLPIADGPRWISESPAPDGGEVNEEDVQDWGHKNIAIPEAWKIATGRGVKVAVLDTGADHDHRDLKGRIVASKDFTGSRTGPHDVHGHGTHTAGTVGAAKNGVGMVGVAPDCGLLVGKVLNDRGSGSNRWIAAGIDWATESGADVISMSLGGPDPDALTHEAIKRATAKGIIVCCSAGNSGPSDGTEGFPAGYPESVSVAASDVNDAIARFSSRGRNVAVAAPGVNVRNCYPGDRYATMSGTSMACPHVAGVAALYVQWAKANGVKPSATDFKARLAKTCRDLPPAGRDNASGFGLIQAPKLFEGGKPVDPIEPPKPKDPDVIEWVNPGLIWNGRPVKRIVIELLPKPQVIEERESAQPRQQIVTGVVSAVEFVPGGGFVRVKLTNSLSSYSLVIAQITIDGRRATAAELVEWAARTPRVRATLAIDGGSFGAVMRADFACDR